MSDIEAILELIEARASHYNSCSFNPEAGEKKALWDAKWQALSELRQEIAQSLRGADSKLSDQKDLKTRTFWVLSTEMGGESTATIFEEEAAAEAARDRYMSDFRMEHEFKGEAACGIQAIDLPPRSSPASGELDMRFALIKYENGNIRTSLHESEEDLEKELEKFKFTTDYGSDNSEAQYGRHPVLIPR